MGVALTKLKTPQTHSMQVVNFTSLSQLVNMLQQTCQFLHQVAICLLKSRLVATCHLQTWYYLLKQLIVASLVDNKF